MRPLPHCAFALVLLFVGLLVCAGSAHALPQRHALLIGIADYRASGLPSLPGAAQDVAVLQRVLAEPRLGFSERITVLLNDQATHTKLEQAFADLTTRIAPGDLVYVHYSGHGSQAPDRNNDETDGFDVTWVPFGARTAKAAAGLDRHDVLDDEINLWLGPLLARAGEVIFVSDSCHSASITRGQAATVIRAVPPGAGPAHPLAERPFQRIDSDRLITIGAARDTESASEFNDEEGRSFGLFTWHWAKSLLATGSGDTWRDLFTTTAAGVRHQRDNQNPQLDGRATAAILPGDQALAGRRSVTVTRLFGGGQIQVDGGAIDGLTRGSVFQRVGPEHSDEESGTGIRIAHVRPFFAVGEGGEGLAVGDRLVETMHSYEVVPAQVCLDAALPNDAPLVERLAKEIRRNDALGGYVVNEKGGACDLVLAVARPSGGTTATAGSALPASAPGNAPEVWVLDDTNRLRNDKLRFDLADQAKGIAALGEALKTLARAREIRYLDSGFQPEFDVRVTIWDRVERCGKGEKDCLELGDHGVAVRKGRSVSHRDLDGTSLPAGTLLTFAMENRGGKQYYACLLNIDPSGKIEPIYPSSDAGGLTPAIAAGKSSAGEDLVGILTEESGEETIKLIVALRPFRANVYDQAGVAATRSAPGGNPMEQLLLSAMGATRGDPVSYQGESWGAIQFSVNVAP